MLDRVLSARNREYAPANPVEQENVAKTRQKEIFIKNQRIYWWAA